MPDSRVTSFCTLSRNVAQSKLAPVTVQPKPGASAKLGANSDPYTSSFFGTQPRITQVPPMRYSSAIVTLAPYCAAMRAARTPREPPPITKKSTSDIEHDPQKCEAVLGQDHAPFNKRPSAPLLPF